MADTRLTEHDRSLPPQKGTIKSCMLPGDICVSFSNSPDLAMRDLEKYIVCYPNGGNEVDTIKFFENSSKDTDNEYIVAFSQPAKLIKIVDGRRVDNWSKMHWIGDRDAYSRFREYAGRTIRRPENGRAINNVLFADELEKSPASDLFSAMRNVVNDSSMSSVGGFVSVISNRENGFRYSVYSDMLHDWPTSKDENYDLRLEDRIDLGATGENEGYAVAQISPGFMGLNLTAFYYTKGKKLFLFYGENNCLPTQCKVFENTAAVDIYSTLNKFLKVDYRWLMVITSPQSMVLPAENTLGNKNEGIRFPFLVEANTFPKS